MAIDTRKSHRVTACLSTAARGRNVGCRRCTFDVHSGINLDPSSTTLTQETVLYIEMDGSQMEEEESEPGSVFASENGRWDLNVLKNGKGDL